MLGGGEPAHAFERVCFFCYPSAAIATQYSADGRLMMREEANSVEGQQRR